MKIHLKNIGLIKKLDFELRRGLTLFCGPNSTGKTYAAYAVYSVLQGMRRWQREWVSQDQLDDLKLKGSLTIDLAKLLNSPDDLENLSSKLSQNIGRDFAAPDGFFSHDCIELSKLPFQSVIRPVKYLGHGYQINAGEEGITLEIRANGSPEQQQNLPEQALIGTNAAITSIYTFSYLPRAVVLTAERAAIQLFSSEILAARSGLVNDMLDVFTARRVLINDSTVLGRATRYSSPINAGLEMAALLNTAAKEKGDFADLATKLEKSILGGQVQMGGAGEVNFMQGGDKPALRIELSASIIKSLASLVFYLRHQSQHGDVLIIDEPELNLHPDNQRKLARFLCELSNAGLDIIISTHSDYIIREVNNLVLLNKPALAGVKERNGYQDAELIKPENVSVVMFNLEGLPEQIEIGKDGFTVASIDDEIARMNRIASEIMLESEE